MGPSLLDICAYLEVKFLSVSRDEKAIGEG